MTKRSAVILLAALTLLGAAQAADAALQAVAPGPYLAAYGFYPAWYQDTTGLQLELCVTQAADPGLPPDPVTGAPAFMCLLAQPDLTQPQVFPTNWSDENFWFTGDASMTTNGLDMILVTAIEAAFSTGAEVVDGAQITFARVRIRIDVPSPGGVYTVTTPYGTFRCGGETCVPLGSPDPAPAAAGRRGINFTEDSGLGGTPFTGAVGGRIGPFLRSAVSPGGAACPAAPAAGNCPTLQVGTETFVGNPNVEQFVTGSPFNTNYFRVEGPGIGRDANLPCDSAPAPADANNCVETKLFAVSGKVFDGRLPTSVIVDRSTYSRSAEGSHIDVFATSPAGSALSFRDTLVAGGTSTPMVAAGGKFYGQEVNPSSIPSFVVVTATNPAGTTGPAELASRVVDVVKITKAQYALDTKTLLVGATSSDQVGLPILTAVGFGQLAPTGTLELPNVVAPPAKITVISARGGRDTEPVQIVGSAFNGDPIAGNDSAATLQGVPVTISVLANDTDPNQPLTVANLTQPANGTATVQGENTVLYTPNSGFLGTDSFTYQAQDARGGLSKVATVTVTVHRPPTALNDSANVPQQEDPPALPTTSVTIPVFFNDSDPDGNTPLTVANLTQPASGTSAVVAGGVRYTPPVGFFGQVTFTYQARDSLGALSNVATVTVNVQKAGPVANPDTAITNFGVPVTINVLANDTGLPVAVATVTAISAGTAVIVNGTQVLYTPAAGFSGTATFSYQSRDNLGQLSNPALVTVNVNPSATETITATASARVRVQRGVQSAEWTINGTITPRSPSVTVRLNRTNQQLGGTLVTDTKGRFKLSLKDSQIIPQAGDTITVRSAAGTERNFPVTVR
jgi:hypothetical protein